MEYLLASMDGMSTAAFRSLCFEYGADGATTEMLGAVGVARAKGRRRPIMDALLSRREEETRLAAQIYGNEPVIMALAAQKLEALERFDMIEINMGCPARCVVGSGNGSALLKNPLLAGQIIEAVCRAVKLPVRLKLRLGWDEEHITAPEIARIAQDAGCNSVILHGRTRSQMYAGDVNLSAMRQVRKAITIPLYTNGAVSSALDAHSFAESVGADGVCIGRAALKMPWIFDDIRRLNRGEGIKERDAVERVSLLLRFAQRLCEQKPERFAICELRKFSKWWLEDLPSSKLCFEAVKEAWTLDAFRSIHERQLDQWIQQNTLLPIKDAGKQCSLDTVQRSV